MRSEKICRKTFQRSLGLVGAFVLVGLLVSADADAQGNRGGGWLRSYAAPHERPARETPAFAPEQARRIEADDSRNQRRWSSEERLQLRRDVHEAGRDVYGSPPRRRH